jgi:hypothetical protein
MYGCSLLGERVCPFRSAAQLICMHLRLAGADLLLPLLLRQPQHREQLLLLHTWRASRALFSHQTHQCNYYALPAVSSMAAQT